MPTCWRRDGSFWLSFLVSWCDFVYEGRGPGGKRQGRDRKQGWEWKWANNQHLHGKCKPGNDTHSHIYKEIVSIFYILTVVKPSICLLQALFFDRRPYFNCQATNKITRRARKRLCLQTATRCHYDILTLGFTVWCFYCDDTNACMCERWIIVWQVRSAACTRWWSDVRKRRDEGEKIRDEWIKFILKEWVIFRNIQLTCSFPL